MVCRRSGAGCAYPFQAPRSGQASSRSAELATIPDGGPGPRASLPSTLQARLTTSRGMSESRHLLRTWDGPVTAVAWLRATDGQRRRALTGVRCLGILDGLRRGDAAADLRAVYRLATGTETALPW